MTDYPSAPDANGAADKAADDPKKKDRFDCDCCDAADCCDVFSLWLPLVFVWRSLRALPHTPRVEHGNPGQRAAVRLIRAYQRGVSARRTRPVCRSEPSCSAYGIEAVHRHGLARGSVLIGRRLRRCKRGGFDPVPR